MQSHTMPIGSEMDFETLFSYDYAEHRWDDETIDSSSSTTETTSLLGDTDSAYVTMTPTDDGMGTSVTDMVAKILLITVLLIGLSIGVFLLILQYNQDHILPPRDVERPVTRSEWDHPFHAETVIMEETGTRQCQKLESCAPLLRELKDKFGVNDSLPYNFLLSSDGVAYEGLGWFDISPLYPELKAIVLAFIGDFTYEVPDIEQVEMAKSLIEDFLNKGYLVKNYTVGGKLYEKFKDSPQWIQLGSGILYS